MHVRPVRALSIAACTILSLCVSNADVASSNNKIRGFLINARAIAMRCFCPPDNCAPFVPKLVSYP